MYTYLKKGQIIIKFRNPITSTRPISHHNSFQKLKNGRRKEFNTLPLMNKIGIVAGHPWEMVQDGHLPE